MGKRTPNSLERTLTSSSSSWGNSSEIKSAKLSFFSLCFRPILQTPEKEGRILLFFAGFLSREIFAPILESHFVGDFQVEQRVEREYRANLLTTTTSTVVFSLSLSSGGFSLGFASTPSRQQSLAASAASAFAVLATKSSLAL